MKCLDLENCGCAEAFAFRMERAETYAFDLKASTPVPDTEASETRGVSDTPYGDLLREGLTAQKILLAKRILEQEEESWDVVKTLIERGKNYGDFSDNARYAQLLKTVVRNAKAWKDAPPYAQEAIDLILSKFARMLSGDPTYVDNWHDIAGYATLVEQRLNKRS